MKAPVRRFQQTARSGPPIAWPRFQLTAGTGRGFYIGPVSGKAFSDPLTDKLDFLAAQSSSFTLGRHLQFFIIRRQTLNQLLAAGFPGTIAAYPPKSAREPASVSNLKPVALSSSSGPWQVRQLLTARADLSVEINFFCVCKIDIHKQQRNEQARHQQRDCVAKWSKQFHDSETINGRWVQTAGSAEKQAGEQGNWFLWVRKFL